VTDFNELQEELAMALLDEDWKKGQKAKAAKSDNGDWHYHNDKHYLHKDRADFHKAVAKVMLRPEHAKLAAKHGLGFSAKEYKKHQQQGNRHQALADAHAEMRKNAKEPEGLKRTLKPYR